MSAMVATLVALLVAVTISVPVGRVVRAPMPESMPESTGATGRRAFRRAVPGLRRRSNVVRPSALAAWADDLARALRHGSTLHAALSETMPADATVRHRSAALRHWLARGVGVSAACAEWSDELADHLDATRRRDRTELLATMSAVVTAAATVGGSAAAPLDRFAVTMRQRASDDLERASQSAQAQMSAKVLTSIPIAVLALLILTDDDVRGAIASLAGGAAVATGLALDAVGALWMRRIAGSASRGAPC